MKTCHKNSGGILLSIVLLIPLLLVCGNNIAQVANLNPHATASPALVSQKNSNLFSTTGSFIQNIGQYKEELPGFTGMGRILYAYEGSGMPVLFTQNGIIHLQREVKQVSPAERMQLLKKGLKQKDIDKANTVNRTISMQWLNANPHALVVPEEKTESYITYWYLKEKAAIYRKLVYKELYPGIDVLYSFDDSKPAGFEYSIIAKPGADISRVQLKYGGDVKTFTQDKNGNLVITSSIGSISVSEAECYYSDDRSKRFTSPFGLSNNIVRFKLPANYDKQKELVIDPFVSGTGGLSGSDAGKARDIDFDFAGNIYVTGGGNGLVQKLSKYNALGVLQWTFDGSLGSPCWEFGSGHGGWVIDKTTGDIYLGQGINDDGVRIIRLNASGSWDNYITDPDPSFTQNWKMAWTCNSGNPQIYIAGGSGTGAGSTSNTELIRFSPASQSFHPMNITGINTGNTDISDLVIDPATTELYSIFSTSILDPREDNKLYRHRLPFNHHDVLWNTTTGCFALHEPVNRPYLSGIDNSSNTIAVNTGYLFYWDGRNLKAFKKSDGSAACATLVLPGNQLLMQGGVVTDGCGHVFTGSSNGTIKVYSFNGSSFDDNAAPDITIPGNAANAVYDLAYNPATNVLYASGNGFVASFDLSSYCPGVSYSLNIVPGCSSLSVSAAVNPAPAPGISVVYKLYDGNTLIGTNSTGEFTGLSAGKNYSIVALVNGICSGIRVTQDFTAVPPPTLKINTTAGICAENSFDLTAASVTAGSSSALTFTYWLDASATLPHPDPSKAKPGIYYIKATNINGCSTIAPAEIKAYPAPWANAGADTIVCDGTTSFTLKGSGGIGYSWAPSTYLSNPAISNPVVNYPGSSGTIRYKLKVTDAKGCISANEDEVTITFAKPAPIQISADSASAISQPLQLNVTEPLNSGFTDYRWSPTYGLNNPFIKNPVAKLDRDITYTVQAVNRYKCISTASVSIKVFRGPEIYVPNSFTPNGDGLNDALKAIPVGLVEFHYLKIFNRFGQLIFTITDPAKGWDGRVNGELGFGTYIWIGEGIDYKGNLIMRKGATSIIR